MVSGMNEMVVESVRVHMLSSQHVVILKQAERDPKIVAITAAMDSGTGLDIFAKKFPERMFDVGIAEQHAVTFAAGLAAARLKPFGTI